MDKGGGATALSPLSPCSARCRRSCTSGGSAATPAPPSESLSEEALPSSLSLSSLSLAEELGAEEELLPESSSESVPPPPDSLGMKS